MSLTLHFHPLSSFCQKVLVGLYELDVPFTKHVVDLGDEASRAAFAKIWPLTKFPVLRDETRERTVPESTIILEYVDALGASRTRLLPSDPDAARECRLADRLFDEYVELPMQKIVGDNLRPKDARDPFGVEQAKALLRTTYDLLETRLHGRTWASGDTFTLADCGAAPALFFAQRVVPFGDRPVLRDYYERLERRPSVARTFAEAKPYLELVPA